MALPKHTKPLIPLISTDEVFLDITDREIPGVYDAYMISNYGRVYSKLVSRIMKPGLNKAGYLFIEAYTNNGPKPMAIHRAEMLAFKYIQGCESLDVNHIDGNKFNNCLYNLEWCSHRENIIHAYNNGLSKKGENSVHSKITEKTAKEICNLLETGLYTNKQIASICGEGATESIVDSIKRGDAWTDVSNKYSFHKRPARLFSDNDIISLCLYFEHNPIGNLTVNAYCKKALRDCGYDNSDRYVDALRKVYTRKYRTNISKDYKF